MITFTVKLGDNEITRQYDEEKIDSEKLGEEVVDMVETLKLIN